jgi:cell cycle sensor histidine kinase DivJ
MTISVEDTGVGIAAEDLPKIGQPFFQARAAYDRRHDGTGLGLSIVQGLVTLHGGDLDIASRLGEGTRITVRLPVDCEAARPPREAPDGSKIAHPSFERAPATVAGREPEPIKRRA